MIQETEKAYNVGYQLFARPASQEEFTKPTLKPLAFPIWHGKAFAKIIGMDVSHRAPEIAKDRLHYDHMPLATVPGYSA
jgi:hypothetical protein